MIKFICSFYLFINFFSCMIILFHLLNNYNKIFIINLGHWVKFNNLVIDWEFCIDSMNILMLFVVIFVSILVHLYSWDYMDKDPHFTRFISYLSLFTFFMIILLAANNFIIMFIGWEGVGLSSYLLINFWYTRIQANKAAIKAMLINKVGDFALLIGMLLIFKTFETFNYHEIFLLNYLYKSKMDLICFFLFIGCMGKSAQLGLHMWLPDAMEGPTPVSALIHAATMVTAGVFLVIKCSFMFEFAEFTLGFISIIGSLTALFGASVGFMQYDIKKIIAYSTCSQLGLMFCACGLSAYSLALFHLINHAFFKALLFLCAGSVIHALNDEQDIRKMGSLKNLLPFTYIAMLIASLSLMGFPFLSGFYSKELILFIVYLDQFRFSFIKFLFIYLASILTVLYSLKILYKVFFNNVLGLKKKYLNVHEAKPIVLTIYFILIFFSIFSGYLLKDFIVGHGSIFFNNSIFYLPKNYTLVYSEFISPFIKILIFFIPILGFIIYIFIKKYNFLSNKYYLFYIFINKKYFFDRFLNVINLQFINLSFSFFYRVIDKGIIEMCIRTQINYINKLSTFIKNLSKFNLKVYMSLLVYLSIFLIIYICLYNAIVSDSWCRLVSFGFPFFHFKRLYRKYRRIFYKLLMDTDIDKEGRVDFTDYGKISYDFNFKENVERMKKEQKYNEHYRMGLVLKISIFESILLSEKYALEKLKFHLRCLKFIRILIFKFLVKKLKLYLKLHDYLVSKY
jgi:proton-translocating NADH-quinone oxidoreductase chain L